MIEKLVLFDMGTLYWFRYVCGSKSMQLTKGRIEPFEELESECSSEYEIVEAW